MTSNIQVKRICQHCNEEFTARTLQTRYCSHKCNSRAYKLAVKLKNGAQKAQALPQNTIPSVSDISAVSHKPYLSIKEACLLLNASDTSIRRWISEGKINTVRLGKKHIIKRSLLDDMFGVI